MEQARLFVAVWPSATVVEALRGLARPDMPGLRWTTAEQWHVTLRFLGWCPIEPVTAALAGTPVRATAARLGPALIRLGRVLAAPVSGLEEAAGAVAEATADLGRPPDQRPFTGHITLARSRARIPAVFEATPIDGEWQVEEICLVASRPHRGGARYEVLHRFPAG